MDGDAVLKAVGTLTVQLSKAIRFSNRYFNCSGMLSIQLDQVEGFRKKHRDEHLEWHQEIREALKTLVEHNYRIPDEWEGINVSTPQVCFSSLPVAQSHKATGNFGVSSSWKVWVIGAGDNIMEIKTNPLRRPICANEWIGNQVHSLVNELPPELECDSNFHGAFDDNLVRWWEDVLAAIKDEERALQRSQAEWRTTGQPVPVNENPQGEIPAEYREIGKQNGEPLTVAYVSRPETYNLSGSYLSKQSPTLSTIKFGRKKVYLFADVARLSAAKNQPENEGH